MCFERVCENLSLPVLRAWELGQVLMHRTGIYLMIINNLYTMTKNYSNN